MKIYHGSYFLFLEITEEQQIESALKTYKVVINK